MRNYNMSESEKAFQLEAEANASRVSIADISAEVGYTSERIEGETEGSALSLEEGGTSAFYLQQLADTIDYSLNNEAARDAIEEGTFMTFHPADSEPVPLVQPTLASRSVVLKLHGVNSKPSKATVPYGSTVRSKPVDTLLHVSLALTRYDSETDGLVTENALKREAASLMEQLDAEVVVQAVKALRTHANVAKYMQIKNVDIKLNSSAIERVEALDDAIDQALIIGKQFGNKIDDFLIALNPQSYRDYDRLARRSGASNVSDLLGTEVHIIPSDPGATDDLQLIVIPKRFVCASFACDTQGNFLRTIVSRQGAKQASTLELSATLALQVAGFTKAQADGKDVDVSLPLITAFKAGTPTPSFAAPITE